MEQILDYVKDKLVVSLCPNAAATKGKSEHVLVIYTDNPVRECWSGTLQLNTPTEIFVGVCHSATQFLARWYADITTDEGLTAQSFLGAGACPIGSNTMQLIDMAKKQQCSVSFKTTLKPRKVPQPILNPRARALVDASNRAHSGLRFHPNEEFSYVSVLIGPEVQELPLLWYPLVALRAAETDYSTQTLSRLLALASHFKPRAKDGQLLADTLTFPSLGWRYTADKTPSGIYADCWSNLFTFPNPERAAFDCEDGAQASLELFNVLISLDLNPRSPLARIQALARKYTPFLVVGEIKSGGKYVLHCFMVLLGLDDNKSLPAINIESTAFSSGEWCRDAIDESIEEDQREYRECMQASKDIPTARIRSPVSMVCEQKMYGRIFSLFGCTKTRARHWLLVRDGKLGIDTNAFLLDPTSHLQNIKVAIDLPTEELQSILQPELDLFPHSRFPLPPADLQLPASRRCILIPDGKGVGVMGKMVLGNV